MEKQSGMQLDDPVKKGIEDSKHSIYSDLMAGFTIANNVLGWFTVTLEVFIRRNFGERYLTFFRLTTGFFILLSFVILPNLVTGTWKGKFTPSILTALVFIAYTGLAVWHKFTIYRRNKKGIRHHSRNCGTPWGIYRNFFSYWNTYLYAEPIFCIVILLILGLCKQAVLFYWLLICIVAIAIRRQLHYQQERNRFLDQIDAQIDGNYNGQLQKGGKDFKDGIETRNYGKMEGWTVPPMDLLPQLQEDTAPKQSVADAVKESMN